MYVWDVHTFKFYLLFVIYDHVECLVLYVLSFKI